jgi:16S rRNA (guanine966-N2)-methyltransferase
MEPFSLMFADPPYGKGLGEAALQSAAQGGWLALDALCVLEETSKATIVLPDNFEEVDRREMGESQLLFLRHRAG